VQAVEVYHQVQRYGSLDAVLQVRPLQLSEQERDVLFICLEWLTAHWSALAQ
jgi:hypothetical protein